MRTLTALLLATFIPVFANGQFITADREFRGSWVTTAWGLDWPSNIGAPMEEQMEELQLILNFHQQQNLNAVVFQVSARGDAIYPSQQLPWSYVLTGQPGEDPGWDPLSFLIDEAQKRGIEVHAWFNVFSIAYNSSSDSPANSDNPNIRFLKPEWMVSIYEGEKEHVWLNPGIPDAREWQIQNVEELIKNYEIDGIHFDRVRYFTDAYEGDDELFSTYNPEEFSDIEDWRRYNITEFVKDASAIIRDVNPHIKIGAAVSGHYNHQSSDGWPARYGYNDVYADSRYWAEQGYVDYLSPMNYWSIDPAPEFDFITEDWAANHNDSTHIYMGIGAYKQDVFTELDQQIDVTRQPGIRGQLYFRYQNISNVNNKFDNRYEHPALIPSLPGRDGERPAPVTDLEIQNNTDSLTMSWTAPEDTVQYKYAVYRSVEESGSQMILHAVTGRQHYSIPADVWMNMYEENVDIAVTALDWNYRESDPAVTSAMVTSIQNREIASEFRLHQNYPNPFNPRTNIQFELPAPNHVSLTVYDITGRKIAVLVDEYLQDGVHTISFDAAGLASGIYIYQLQSDESVVTKRMTVIK